MVYYQLLCCGLYLDFAGHHVEYFAQANFPTAEQARTVARLHQQDCHVKEGPILVTVQDHHSMEDTDGEEG